MAGEPNKGGMGPGWTPWGPGTSIYGEGGQGKNAPAPPDYMGMARSNRQGPMGGVNWTQGPDGQWTQTQGFSGPHQEMFDALTGQAKDAMSQPLDFSGLPAVDYGQDAFNKATDASFNQARSRLDPMFQQREGAMNSTLAAQGLTPGSEAYRNAQDDFGRGRTDAYNQALYSAIGQGREAANSMFQQSMGARQQAMIEALRKRSGPLGEMAQMLSMNRAPSGDLGALLQAAGMKDASDYRNWDKSQTDLGELLNALGGLGNILSPRRGDD